MYGAYGYDVQARCTGETDWNDGCVTETTWWALWIPGGGVFEVRIRAQAGEVEKSAWTEVKSVVHGLS